MRRQTVLNGRHSSLHICDEGEAIRGLRQRRVGGSERTGVEVKVCHMREVES